MIANRTTSSSEFTMCGNLTISARTITGLLTRLLFAILVIPINAQSTRDCRQYYDVSQEVTLRGAVSGVLTKPARGMIMGSHLLLTTVFGPVDASLGRWGLQGEDALSVTVGQQVEVTGVMKTLKNKAVFVVRIVEIGDKVYRMRNEHGIPLSPQARERAIERTQNGDSL
jgi:hypothetical protein